MTNAYVKLKQILPPAPVLVGLVTAHHEDDTSTVVLPTQEGRIEYAAGVAVGSTIRARGTTVPVGDKAFVRNGVIETRAPDGDPVEIEVGRVVPAPVPLVFSGPINDLAGTVGAAFSLDVSGYWTGGVAPATFSLVAGTLPAGLTLSSAGVISGTPNAGTVASGLVVRATDRAGYRADSNAFAVAVAVAVAADLAGVYSILAPSGKWVAVGANGSSQVATSTDGVSWTLRTAAASNQWVSVAFGNGVFVAVGQLLTGLGKVMTSPDGITWTAQSGADSTSGWAAVTFGNGLFVATRNAPAGTQRIMTSPDGITWTLRTHASEGYLWSVTYGNGLFVALSYYGSNALTSPDGVTWTARSIPSGGWRSVAYSPTLGLFAAVSEVAASNNVMTSPDGITWTRRTNPDAAEGWLSLCAGPGGMFVSVTSPAASKQKTIRSTDGTTWTVSTNIPAPSPGEWGPALGYNGTTLVALASGLGGSPGVTARSTDGVNWTTGSSPAGQNWSSVVWGAA